MDETLPDMPADIRHKRSIKTSSGYLMVTGSLEITVLLHPARLERIVDPVIQANILQL